MKFLASILFLAATVLGVAAPAPIQRNDWTTNPAPQVNRGYGITIQTNAGHKLVINVDGGALTNQIYWTNIAGLLRTIGEGRYTNLWIDTNIAAMTIGSIASIDPTNGNAFYGAGAGSNNVLTITGSVGVGSDALGNNSGAVSDSLAFGEAAFRDNSGTISISSAIGQGAGVQNSGSIENSTLIGSQAMANNTAVKRGVVAIGHQALSTFASADITNMAMVGTVIGNPATGVNLGSFGFNNTFAAIGASSNRWIIGWSATNTRANSMVFGSGITNYNFRNLEYTFPVGQGAGVMINNGGGLLSWSNTIVNTATGLVPLVLNGIAGTTTNTFETQSNNIVVGGFSNGLFHAIRGFGMTTNSARLEFITSGAGIEFYRNDNTIIGAVSVNSWRANRFDLEITGGSATSIGKVSSGVVFAGNALGNGGGLKTWFFTNTVPITNQSPYVWTNFAVASANGITTNDRLRSLLRGQMKFTLGAIADVAEIIFTVTNGASVYSLTNGMDTAVGAAGSRISFLALIGPTNTFAFTTNVSGTGTAVINNMTMEPQ